VKKIRANKPVAAAVVFTAQEIADSTSSASDHDEIARSIHLVANFLVSVIPLIL
jgi:hypothetical protein